MEKLIDEQYQGRLWAEYKEDKSPAHSLAAPHRMRDTVFAGRTVFECRPIRRSRRSRAKPRGSGQGGEAALWAIDEVGARGDDYKNYKEYVPALIPYKGAGGRRYREQYETFYDPY